MERDNFEISQELEQMREQFRILTEKVEKQNIVYEKQLRASMRKRVNTYNLLEVWMPIIVLIVGCPIIYVIMIQRAGMPVWTNIMLWAYFATVVVALLIKKIKQDRILDYKGDIKQFANNVKTVKKWHVRFNAIGSAAGVIFIIPFYMEYVKAVNRTVAISREALIVSIIVMVIILVLDMYFDTRKGRLLDNIIKEIEE